VNEGMSVIEDEGMCVVCLFLLEHLGGRDLLVRDNAAGA
jgi:hypothetical protein